VLVAAPAYLRRKGEPATPEALAKHDVLASPVVAPADIWTLTSAARTARVRLNATFRSNALHALRDLAAGGAGLALLPEFLVADLVRTRALRVLLRDWQTDLVAVNAIHRTEHRGAPLVRALVEHLRAAYARDAG